MTKLDELQLLYYFGEFVIEYGYDIENRRNKFKTLAIFLNECIDCYENTEDKDELPWFQQSVENIDTMEAYLLKFLEVTK